MSLRQTVAALFLFVVRGRVGRVRSMNRTTAVLFDLDGTLLDSRGDLADAANATRAHIGLAALSDEAVEAHTGSGMMALLRGVLPEVEPSALETLREVFVAHYRAHLLDRSRPFPGVDAMFDALAGAALGLVTNKPTMFTAPILEGLGWSARFGVVVCGDTTPWRKPSPEPLLHGLAALGVGADRAVFVGDTPIDAETAAAAQVDFVCVGWGRAAARTDPSRVVASLDALPAVVERLRTAR
jgi:2-phosphoglycolate phosphatase